MSFIIGSFYTEGEYEKVINTYLRKSIRKLNLQNIYHEICISNYNKWITNVQQKPACILNLLEAQEKDVLFLDADAYIHSYPSLIDSIQEDFGFFFLDRDKWYNRNLREEKELLSGTLFLKNNSFVKEIVREWKERCIGRNEWEQKILDKLVREKNLKYYEFPLEYCYIASLPDGREPFIKIDNPVITHHQVSRIYKKIYK